jgi:hypothetical protein
VVNKLNLRDNFTFFFKVRTTETILQFETSWESGNLVDIVVGVSVATDIKQISDFLFVRGLLNDTFCIAV